MATNIRKEVYNQSLYPATKTDGVMLYACMRGGTVFQNGDTMAQLFGYSIFPLCFIIDLPISIVTDTLCLPYDIHRISTDTKPLAVAVNDGDITEVKILLDNGADPNLEYQSNTPLILSCTPLINACRGNRKNNFQGDIEMVKLLIQYGADVNKATPIAYTDNLDITFILIDNGAILPTRSEVKKIRK